MASLSALFMDVHRPFFLAGIFYALTAIGLWTLHLLGILSYALPVAQAQIHMAQMIYFLFPFYIFGFLLTIFPRQMSVPAISRRVFTSIFVCYFSGATAFTAGIFVGQIWLRIGILLACLAFIFIASAMFNMLIKSRHPQKRVPVFIWIGIVFGCLGILSLALFSFSDDETWLHISEAVGLYGFLLPTIYAVAYRMVPIFTATNSREVRRIRSGLHLLFGLCMVRMLVTGMQLYDWYWLPDLGLFTVVSCQLWQWRVWKQRPFVIQSVLHWAMIWFPLAFLLSSIASLAELMTHSRWLPVEQAALHALVVGGFGTLILGMVTRITLGHAHLPVMADRHTNALFIGFQIVPLLRTGSGLALPLWPQFSIGIIAAGVCWLLFFGLWSWRYAPLYLGRRHNPTRLEPLRG